MRVHHSQALGSTTTICLPAVGWPVTLPASQQVHSNPAATTRCCLTLQKVQRRLSHTGHNDGAHRSAMGNNAKSNIASANPQSAHTLSLHLASNYHQPGVRQRHDACQMGRLRQGGCYTQLSQPLSMHLQCPRVCAALLLQGEILHNRCCATTLQHAADNMAPLAVAKAA